MREKHLVSTHIPSLLIVFTMFCGCATDTMVPICFYRVLDKKTDAAFSSGLPELKGGSYGIGNAGICTIYVDSRCAADVIERLRQRVKDHEIDVKFYSDAPLSQDAFYKWLNGENK